MAAVLLIPESGTEAGGGQQQPRGSGHTTSGPDEFRVRVLPTGGIVYEFASQSAAAKVFGTHSVVTTVEALRELVMDLVQRNVAPSAASHRKGASGPADRNLVTTREFADFLNCAESSVFEMLKLGLPSIKSPRLGRRILKAEAEAWLLAGGATRSRTAKRLRKTNGTPG